MSFYERDILEQAGVVDPDSEPITDRDLADAEDEWAGVSNLDNSKTEAVED